MLVQCCRAMQAPKSSGLEPSSVCVTRAAAVAAAAQEETRFSTSSDATGQLRRRKWQRQQTGRQTMSEWAKAHPQHNGLREPDSTRARQV
jgi:hypothetical protein